MDVDLKSHKSRGLKHATNKRFKPKSVIQKRKENNDKKDKEENKHSLQNNWSRYEELEDDNNTDVSSTNFAVLSETPISKGGHFQFKSDKSEDLEIDENQLFKLDINLITKSLLTLPLTKRCDISEDYFTSEELETINSNAELKKKEYLEYLSKTSEKLEEKDKNFNDDEDTIADINKIKDINIDSVCKGEQDHINAEKENLEEWLDDFLDS